jgi:hypothetical protein
MSWSQSSFVVALGIALGSLWGGASSPAAQAPATEPLLAEAREAAGQGHYEEAARAYALARAAGREGLDTELALASWQAGHDGEALDVLRRSDEDEAALLAHAIRRSLDPALVLAFDHESRARILADVADAQRALDASQVLLWISALASTASVLALVWPEAPCDGGCAPGRHDAAAGLGIASLGTLAIGLTLVIVGQAQRTSAESPLRVDASGLRF